MTKFKIDNELPKVSLEILKKDDLLKWLAKFMFKYQLLFF